MTIAHPPSQDSPPTPVQNHRCCSQPRRGEKTEEKRSYKLTIRVSSAVSLFGFVKICQTLTSKYEEMFRGKKLKWSTSTCSNGIPTDCMTFCGCGFLQRDHRNTSKRTLSQSCFSPFEECGWWLWNLSVSSCTWVRSLCHFPIFSPVKQSSYLHIRNQKFRIRTSLRIHQMNFMISIPQTWTKKMPVY